MLLCIARHGFPLPVSTSATLHMIFKAGRTTKANVEINGVPHQPVRYLVEIHQVSHWLVWYPVDFNVRLTETVHALIIMLRIKNTMQLKKK